MVITARTDGEPLVGASVEWQGNGAAVSDAELVTDANGQARATFNPGEAGDATVSARVQKPGYDVAASAGTISVLSASETTTPSAPRILGVPIAIVAVVALIALGLYVAALLGFAGPIGSTLVARTRRYATV